MKSIQGNPWAAPQQGLIWVAACLLLSAGCGGAEPNAPDGDSAAIHSLKLWNQERAVLQEPEPAGVIATLLDEDFSTGTENWHLSTSLEQPLVADASLLTIELPLDAGNPHLRLSGQRGVLYRLVPVQPSSAYVFRARTRSRGLRAVQGFQDAKPFLAELRSDAAREVLMQSTPTEPLLAVRHLFETCLDTEGWQAHERSFITGPDTRTLLVVADFAFADGVQSGAVDFDDFLLQQVPLRRVWEQRLEFGLLDYGRGEAPFEGWRAQRLLRGYLGAEVRPSILSFPGQQLGFVLQLPTGSPRFEVGLGPWPAAMDSGHAQELGVELWVAGKPIWSQAMRVDEHNLERGWQDFEVDLFPWAGQRVELELRSSGELPALFGSPMIRDADWKPERLNLILISLDTLRADYVGSYGAAGNPTPRLDAFAAAGIRCANVTGQAPYTLPGHATMFSGQFPSVHGAQRPSQVFSGSRSPILARLLSDVGYRTEAFTGGGLMNADFGFDKGFDRFANIDPLRHNDSLFFQNMLQGDPVAKQRLRRNRQGPGEVTRAMIERYGPEQLDAWLGEHQDELFFLFVHTYSVHDYDPPDEFLVCRAAGCEVERRDYNEFRLSRKGGWNPKPVSDAERDHMRHLYEGTVRQADHLVGRLLARVKELGLDQNTIVAIATDHGEEMFERGFQQHGKTLYEELTRLPLMLQIPGIEPRVIEEPVMMVDLAPTLLAALGLPPQAHMNGRNLLETLDPERTTFSEIHDDFVHKYALTTADGYKLIHAPKDDAVSFPAEHEWQLFQLGQDPGEQHDLAPSAPPELARMQAKLQATRAALAAQAAELGNVGTSEISQAVQDQLNELGYGDKQDQ